MSDLWWGVSAHRVLATTRRVASQLRRDPRTVALVLAVPVLLMSLLRYVYNDRTMAFNHSGGPLLTLFPLMTMFLITSVALLRERTSGTLERLMSTPLGKLELLLGYGLAFGALAVAQVSIVFGVSIGLLGLQIAGSELLLGVLCVLVALLGMGLGLLASAFARSEFQVVQFFPAMIVPQLLLCGLLAPRASMQSVLHAISDVLPMSYAVDAVRQLSVHSHADAVLWRSLGLVIAFALAAIALGAATLPRRTD